MDGIGTKQAVELARHDLLGLGVALSDQLGETVLGVVGQHQPSDGAGRIGERGGDGMDAIELDRAVVLVVAALVGRAALVRGLVFHLVGDALAGRASGDSGMDPSPYRRMIGG